MKKLVPLIGLLALVGCSSNKSGTPAVTGKTITSNNFEGGGGWSSDPSHNTPGLVMKGKAHSGQYAIGVDKDHEFSYTYDMILGQINSSKFRKIHLNAWVYMASAKSTANFGLQINNQPPGQMAFTQVYGDDFKFADVTKGKYDTWVEVDKDFTLPENITSSQHLRMFLWRANASDTALLDDITLTLVE